MKILMVNKFLYPNGGSETYIFELGKELQKKGHEVQYFGMEHEGRIVGNRAECYTADMDFHTGRLKKLLYPFKIVYSREAKKKIERVLEDFQPDIVHLNNFSFQLTPSVIYGVKSYEKRRRRRVGIVFTAHDYQLVCPNHMMRIPSTGKNCEECLHGNPGKCFQNRCIHDSRVKSLIGTLEGWVYRRLRTYRYIDCVICPSHFMEEKMNSYPLFREKTVVMHNFVNCSGKPRTEKKEYVLYFGRFSREKGIHTLINVCKKLPDIPFVFAGGGPLENEIEGIKNIQNAGFRSGEELSKLISEAKFSIYPSEWYENCPFSVMESISCGTPVLGADIGGIPELIREGETGELFISGDEDDLCGKIEKLWSDEKTLIKYIQACQNVKFKTAEEYCEEMTELYRGISIHE